MLKRIVVIALALPTLLWAKVPSEDDLMDKITNATGGFYYPDMMLRFEMGDTTLTSEHYHYLYYGYPYHHDYAPQAVNPKMDELIVLASQIDPENPSVTILEDIVSIAGDILKRDPFSPKVWNILSFAYGALGDKNRERDAYDRVEKILSVIDESGDGLKEKSPKHILSFDHALDYMASQNYMTTKAIIVSREVEFVPLVEPLRTEEGRLKGLYFDYSRVYMSRPDTVVMRSRARTWQFNNLKPREYK